jgi:hypothetical protein
MEPDVVPAPERAVDIVVITGKAAAQVALSPRFLGGGDAGIVTSSTKTCGASRMSPRTGQRPAPA